ncbi:MAG: hypothetical protein FJW34_06340 [Acidobacteria bacterium]|nr:hypothetical protein [Acidobacteriota bacterium]
MLLLTIMVVVVARLMWTSYLNHKRWAMQHQERMAALEKGLPPPAGPAAEGWLSNGSPRGLSTSPSYYLLRGLVWLFVGIATMAFFAAISATTVEESVPSWYYSQPSEERKFPPPTARRQPIPVGWSTLGLIPAGVGIAYLIFYRVEGRRRKEEPPEKA